MIRTEWQYLFSDVDLRSVLENQKREAVKRVGAIPAIRLLASGVETLADEITRALRIASIELKEEEITVSQKDVDVDVSHDMRRGVWDRTRPTYVRGLEVTYYLPFSGDKELLKCRPNTFTHSPPRAVVRRQELTFPYDTADRDVVETKKAFDEDVKDIKEWLGWMQQDISELNRTLPDIISAEIAKRQQRVAKEEQEVKSLGFKVRANPVNTVAATPPPKTAREPNADKKKEDHYDVAFSFAGENREYVETVASLLRALGIRIFYDRFETVELWGKNLTDHLGAVYASRSKFVVMFVSKHYQEKAWPNYERQQAQSRAVNEIGKEYILPVRFDDTEIPGLPSTVGYLDLRQMTPKLLAEAIVAKLKC